MNLFNVANKSIRIIIFVISVCLSLLITLDTNLPNGMDYFPLVTLAFGVCYLLSKKMSIYATNNIGLLLLNLTMIVRYLVTPFFMWLNNYSISRGIIPSPENYKIAILLMILEVFVIFITVELFATRYYLNSNLKQKNNINVNKNLITVLFITSTIFIILANPGILQSYTFIFTATEFKRTGDLVGDYGTMAILMVRYSTILITIVLINWFYKYFRKNESKFLVYCSIAIVFLSSSFIVGNSRFSMLLPMVTGLFLIVRLYPKFKREVFSISGILITLALVISTLIKQFGITIGKENNDFNSIISSLGNSLQVYFSGLHNIAVSVRANELFSNNINFEIIFGDLLSSVMLISGYFNSKFGGIEMFNYAFYNHTNSIDQILPMIGQGYLYFGFFFSPLFVFIAIVFMMFFDKKSREGRSVFEVYIFAYIAVRLGLYSMSNATIITSFFTNYFLVLLLILNLNKKIVFKKGR